MVFYLLGSAQTLKIMVTSYVQINLKVTFLTIKKVFNITSCVMGTNGILQCECLSIGWSFNQILLHSILQSN